MFHLTILYHNFRKEEVIYFENFANILDKINVEEKMSVHMWGAFKKRRYSVCTVLQFIEKRMSPWSLLSIGIYIYKYSELNYCLSDWLIFEKKHLYLDSTLPFLLNKLRNRKNVFWLYRRSAPLYTICETLKNTVESIGLIFHVFLNTFFP